MSVALVLLGLGLLVWPVPSAAERRLGRLRRAARVGSPVVDRRRVGSAFADRGRALAGAGVVVAVVVAGVADGPAVAVAAGAGTGAVAVVVLSARSARRSARRRRDLLTALAVLRGELDAGAPFPDALRAARDRAGTAVAAFDLGSPGPGPPATADDPVRHDAVALARRSLTAGAGLVAVTGASWSAVAAGIGRDVTAHDARDQEVASALAGARASTVVLAGLPLLGLGLAAALGADPVRFLLHTSAGSWLLAAGAALDLLGVLTSTAVSARAAR